MVRVGTTQACVLHGHPKKPGSKTDKPAGSVIKCFPFSGEGGRDGAIKKAYQQHYAITKSQAAKENKTYGLERLSCLLKKI